MTPEAINSVINNICAKLELPATKGFEYICAAGVKDLVIGGVMLLVFVVCLLVTLKKSMKLFSAQSAYDQDDALFGMTFWLFACAVVGIIGLPSIADGILYLVSPEAWAVQYLLNRF